MKNVFVLIIATVLLCMSAVAMAAVNINSADAETLSQLPYIGESKSASIIEEREANGEFESVDDLTRVNGIGSKTVDRIRDQVTVDGDSAMSDDCMSEDDTADEAQDN